LNEVLDILILQNGHIRFLLVFLFQLQNDYISIRVN